MHAYCITGATSKHRTDYLQKVLRDNAIAPIDQVYIEKNEDDEHIGISAVRQFTGRLLLSPQASPYIIGIITRADLLTIEAQNALLKLLEEPPPRVKIYIETESKDQLLPTILSRCQSIQLGSSTEDDSLEAEKATIQKLLSSTPSEIMHVIDGAASDRDAAKQWTSQLIVATRALLMAHIHNDGDQKTTSVYMRLVRNLVVAQQELAVNVNPKLVLDTVFLQH